MNITTIRHPYIFDPHNPSYFHLDFEHHPIKGLIPYLPKLPAETLQWMVNNGLYSQNSKAFNAMFSTISDLLNQQVNPEDICYRSYDSNIVLEFTPPQDYLSFTHNLELYELASLHTDTVIYLISKFTEDNSFTLIRCGYISGTNRTRYLLHVQVRDPQHS